MNKRHTLHGATARSDARATPITDRPPAESSTRIRHAGKSTANVEDNIQASIDFALTELEALEVPYSASAPPLAMKPAQQMPRGMPPLPFKAPHPLNMPPLPGRLSAASSVPGPALEASSEAAQDLSPAPGSARVGSWLLVVTLALGVACLALSFWLQSR